MRCPHVKPHRSLIENQSGYHLNESCHSTKHSSKIGILTHWYFHTHHIGRKLVSVYTDLLSHLIQNADICPMKQEIVHLMLRIEPFSMVSFDRSSNITICKNQNCSSIHFQKAGTASWSEKGRSQPFGHRSHSLLFHPYRDFPAWVTCFCLSQEQNPTSAIPKENSLLNDLTNQLP